MQCPDCGSGRRSDGYNRDGWFWLECDRRYNPDTDEYSPENNWCKLKQLEAKYEELHTACLEYLNHPPSNVPARRRFAEIVTGGSCDHLDDDVVTDQHECDWEFVVPYYKGAEKVFIVCRHTSCKTVLTKKMAVAMLNEYEPLKKATDAYHGLIMAVGKKHDGETRHETALRYILEAERGSDTAYADIRKGKDDRAT